VISFFNIRGVRGKIVIGYTSLFIISSIIGGIFVYYKVKKNITASIQAELNRSTDLVLEMIKTAAATSIKNYLKAINEKNIEIVQASYNRFRSGKISEEQAKEEVRRVLFSQTVGKTGYIYCVNSQGVPIEHLNPDVVGKEQWVDKAWVKKMIAMKNGYMEYEWQNPGEHHFKPKAVYIGYFQPWDWILGVSTNTEELKNLINVEDFRENVKSLRYGKTGYLFILDEKGNPIIHPSLESSLVDEIKLMDKDGITDKILQMKNGTLEYSWKNPDETTYREKMVIFNYLPEYSWIVASSVYLEEFHTILDTIKTLFIFSILVMIGLGLLSSFWLNRLIITPVNRLMERLKMGIPENIDMRMPITSLDEFGRLNAYFNDFMAKLEQYSNDLKTEISEHKSTAKSLMESEWRYRTILKCINEGYCEAELNGNIMFLNSSMESITGYSKKELMAKNLLDIIHEKNRPFLTDIFDGNGIKDHAGKIYVWELIRKDQSTCIVETSLSVMIRKYSQQFGIRCVFRDVTDRVKAENALRQSEELFSKSFRFSPSGMFLAHSGNGCLIDANDYFLKFTGHRFKDIAGKSLMELNFFKNKKVGVKFFNLINEEKSIRNLEVDFLTCSGDIREGFLSAEMLKISNETCILGALEDYTEVRRLERQFLDMTENQRKEMSFALHDDLCPQLIGIDMMIDIVKSKIAGGMPDQVHNLEKIEMLIQDSIKKVRLLSQGLCPVDIVMQGFDVSLLELCRYIEDMFNIDCNLNCDIFKPFTDNTAAAHAYYIAHEAVHNAVKHAGASQITIHFSTRKNKTLLMIKDNGIGIDYQTRQRGLGIKIMEYRAKLLNAFLDIRKRSQGGTIVLLELETDHPVARPEQKEEQQ
jgi:PAS domain S-box-containing protein